MTTIPIPALDAFRRHLEGKLGVDHTAADAIAKLDREMSFEPDMPGPLCDAIMEVRNELARRTASPQTLAFLAYDEWCDSIGAAAGIDYSDIPHCTLAEWYTGGLSIKGAATLALDYLADLRRRAGK